ncbi:glycosyltransferase [Breoghania sp.]|uniref:glycosyltransferase family 2 protein n=1 Tax=Breoghania sp. TaxID=2065378 RepID=UPI002612AE5B|nr:glycosyltransferase [Breoghania sp.]MDJ0930607.1 glycosyltransferase [Breoghania sp.]
MAFGAPPELANAVASLRAQSAPCEIVVVNSGGGPAKEILTEHLDVIRLISVETRLYAGAVRNIGIDASTTRYVAFLASDCLATDGWVKGRLDAHRAGYDAVPSNVAPQRGASVAARAVWLWLYSARLGTSPQVDDQIYNLSYNRTLFRHFGYFPPGVRIGEDSIFNRRLDKKIEIAKDADIRHVHCFDQTSEAVAQNIQARARRRVQKCIAPDYRDPNRFCARIRELKRQRLAHTMSALQ